MAYRLEQIVGLVYQYHIDNSYGLRAESFGRCRRGSSSKSRLVHLKTLEGFGEEVPAGIIVPTRGKTSVAFGRTSGFHWLFAY